LPTKNTLTAPDATLVENAFRGRMNILVDQRGDGAEQPDTDAVAADAAVAGSLENEPASNVSAMQKPRRARSKPHRDFVSSQPCLVCGRQPADAHHLRFAQPRALGRKVSDEFIVPLCRVHHRELHRMGDERRWWERVKIDPTEVAQRLWQTTKGIITLRSTGRGTTQNSDPGHCPPQLAKGAGRYPLSSLQSQPDAAGRDSERGIVSQQTDEARTKTVADAGG
jgi:hypothetical protein